MALDPLFRALFGFLSRADYAWQVVSPDRLVRLRKAASDFDPITRFFGLGIEVEAEELFDAGLPTEVFAALGGPLFSGLRPAVSRLGEHFLVHSHWPEPRVYLGEESFSLLRQFGPALDALAGQSVLDLGSGCGVLAFHLAGRARRVLGLELAPEAVIWASAAARAQGLGQLEFRQAMIGQPEAELAPGWDVAVFNPPMAVPSPESRRPHRDGGKLGIEVPLSFLAFAGRHLRPEGEVFCYLTNPILRDGRSALFERIDPALWKIVEKHRLNDHFNHTLYRQDGYQEQGIQRIELWMFRLRKLL